MAKNNQPRKPKKPYGFVYDKLGKRMVLKILDKDTMLPLLVTIPEVPEAEPRELRLTSKGKLHMQ
jgi:hypothetical protein